MDKIKNFLAENYFWIVLILFFGVYLQTCSQQRNNKALVRQNQQLIIQNHELIQQLDTIKHGFVNKEELQLYIKIGGYEVSENILNDFNDFARSRATPTERSRYYQNRREEMELRLNNR